MDIQYDSMHWEWKHFYVPYKKIQLILTGDIPRILFFFKYI